MRTVLTLRGSEGLVNGVGECGDFYFCFVLFFFYQEISPCFCSPIHLSLTHTSLLLTDWLSFSLAGLHLVLDSFAFLPHNCSWMLVHSADPSEVHFFFIALSFSFHSLMCCRGVLYGILIKHTEAKSRLILTLNTKIIVLHSAYVCAYVWVCLC